MKTNNPNDTSTHPHMPSILTQILIYFITHSHWHAVRIRVSSRKDSKGKFAGDTNWMIFRKIRGSLRLNLRHETNMETERQTPGWKAS